MLQSLYILTVMYYLLLPHPIPPTKDHIPHPQPPPQPLSASASASASVEMKSWTFSLHQSEQKLTGKKDAQALFR